MAGFAPARSYTEDELCEECVPNINNYTCSICLKTLTEPGVLNCGHVFDRDCILDLREALCPICRAPIECRDPDCTLAPMECITNTVPIIREYVNNATVLCPYLGCTHHTTLEHINTMVQHTTVCPKGKVYCTAIKPNGEMCREEMTRETTEQHDCPYVTVDCPGCGVTYNKRDEGRHHEMCELVVRLLNQDPDHNDAGWSSGVEKVYTEMLNHYNTSQKNTRIRRAPNFHKGLLPTMIRLMAKLVMTMDRDHIRNDMYKAIFCIDSADRLVEYLTNDSVTNMVSVLTKSIELNHVQTVHKVLEAGLATKLTELWDECPTKNNIMSLMVVVASVDMNSATKIVTRMERVMDKLIDMAGDNNDPDAVYTLVNTLSQCSAHARSPYNYLVMRSQHIDDAISNTNIPLLSSLVKLHHLSNKLVIELDDSSDTNSSASSASGGGGGRVTGSGSSSGRGRVGDKRKKS